MRMIARARVGESVTITAEEPFLLIFKKRRTFVANHESPKGYWNWLELPHNTLIPDNVSFQLDAWERNESARDAAASWRPVEG